MKEESIRKIIKDYKLPIPLIPRYYDYFFELYEPILKTKTLLNTAEKEISFFEKEGTFFDKTYGTINSIISAISDTEAYKNFSDCNNLDFLSSNKKSKYLYYKTKVPFSKKSDVYNTLNNGKKFLSIDLEKANFQVCKAYDKNIVLECDDYSDLVKKFTDSKYFEESKQIRQIIFGKISGSRQSILEKYYTGLIVNFLIDNSFFNEKDIVVYTNDEIVINIKNYLSEEKLLKLYEDIFNKFGLTTHIECFSIKEIYKDCFVKEKNNGKISFKKVPIYYHAQVFKKYFNMPIEKKDLAFLYEGQICFFEKSIENKIMI